MKLVYEVWGCDKYMQLILKQIKKINYNESNNKGWKWKKNNLRKNMT
jgi:hypothetical protein